MRRGLTALASLLLILGACSPKPASAPVVQNPLDAAISRQIGGGTTCVVIEDVKSGAVLYQYGYDSTCAKPWPPCETFEVPLSLIGLDQGVVTRSTVYKWDHTPQRVAAWQTDADLERAFHNAIGWWFAKLAAGIGPNLGAKLHAMGYGDGKLGGSQPTFWMGPMGPGALAISTRGQADFLKRFYAGTSPVGAPAASAVQALMVDETRAGPSAMSDASGSCETTPDGSRRVGWAIGRLKTPSRDVVFAASVEAAEAPSGSDILQSLKDAFADGGLWPQG